MYVPGSKVRIEVRVTEKVELKGFRHNRIRRNKKRKIFMK